MKKMRLTLVIALLVSSIVFADDPTVAEVTHSELQAVNADGYGTYTDTDKVIISGIVLNSPEQMLNPAPGAGYMGGQWQMYIQGEGSDHAGTAVWLGQYYSRASSNPDDYTDQELLDELCRINTDPNSGYIFNAGDRVKVTGWYKFYKGKLNVNEQHMVDPAFDFEIELVKPAVGLPQPDVITLDQVKDENDNYIFDPNRLSGCEYYQARLVRVEDVVIDPNNWGPGNTVSIVDSSGLTFPVLLGIGSGFTRYECPSGPVDVIGIMDQESSGYTVCKDGYRIWVTNYDGNGLVLTDRGYKRGDLPGDINTDFSVDLLDFAELAEGWLKCIPGLCN